MGTLTIRNLDPSLKEKLRVTAARHGHSMEEEVRLILRKALDQPSPGTGLGSRIHARFADIGGFEPEWPERTESPQASDFHDGDPA